MLRSAMALVLTVVPGVALADMTVDVHLRTPAMRVSVATGPAYSHPAEVQPPAPSPDHTWIDGHWGRHAGRRVWVPGRWVLPPGPDYVWEPARWVNQGGAVVYHQGHWRHVPRAVVYMPEPVYAPVVVETSPPAPMVEARPVAPMVGAVWIPGSWQWHGRRYVWVKGRWSAPRPGHVWQADGWRRDGHRRWVYGAGHWRRDSHEGSHRGRDHGWHRDRDRDRHHDRDDDRRRDRGHRKGHRKHHRS